MTIFYLKNLAGLIAVSLFLQTCTPVHAPDAQETEVNKLFAQWDMKTSPGCALGIVKDGELVYLRGYGMADLEHDIPITPSSVFYIGSVSKQFVTMCILLLEEEGKLALDDEIQLFLPDFPRYNAPLTIRNFIHHTSGVRDYLTLWNLAGNDYLDHIDEGAVYQMIRRQKELNFNPGERYLYSNSCYFMLAMIVEQVSGLSLKEYANKHLFGPLGMKHSHFHDDYLHLIKNRAFSYEATENGFNNLIMRFDLVGSGGVYSSIDDLYLWDQNFYNNKLGKKDPDLILRMHEEGLLNNGESSGYAFALVNGTYRGLKTVSHAGALAGYRAQLMRFPDERLSIILLGNIASFNSTDMARKVADIYLAEFLGPVEEMGDPSDNSFAESKNKEFANQDLSRFSGTYYSEELDVNYKIFTENKDLFYRVKYNDPKKLNPVDVGIFTTDTNVKIHFKESEKGLISNLVLDAGRVRNLQLVKTGS